ncbi:MAG: hypothetical protein C4527_05700 [Candidatus Omnitrophota bacterium]|nr:MAG: hypothetical protein C4527_05700 [Candidatus Omnitrophota bacterium]
MRIYLLIPIVMLCAHGGEVVLSVSDIRISSDFENGSLGSWRINDAGEIILTHAPGSGDLWYFFRVDGVLHQTLTFVFESARNDLFGDHNLPAWSYDLNQWSFIKTRFIQPHPTNPQQTRFSFTCTFAQNHAWIAYTPPFSNTLLDQLLNRFAEHPHLHVYDLCETPIEHLHLPILQITDSETPKEEKQTILLLCREEAYETASSWVGYGAIRFLLSDDPIAAAIKRRCLFLVIPIFDRDGVALGRAVHPLSRERGEVYWTETWPEKEYSFYEQRQLKRFLQRWKDQGKTIDLSIRLHSNSWREDLVRREFCSDANIPAQDAFFMDILGKEHLPWYRNVDRTLRETRFSKFVWDVFPQAITASSLHEYLFSDVIAQEFILYKTIDDLMVEGELMARAIGQSVGVPASDPPPFLHGAECYENAGLTAQTFHVRCIYRDLLNRPPEFVRVVVNEEPFELFPVNTETPDYQKGVIFAGFVEAKTESNRHYFQASNGSNTFRVPYAGERAGPYLLSRDSSTK